MKQVIAIAGILGLAGLLAGWRTALGLALAFLLYWLYRKPSE